MVMNSQYWAAPFEVPKVLSCCIEEKKMDLRNYDKNFFSSLPSIEMNKQIEEEKEHDGRKRQINQSD